MILTCNYLASCTSITNSTGHYSCFAVGACCVCRCLSKIGRHDCCLTSEKNDLFKSRIGLRYMYAHRLFTSSSGLCHPGIIILLCWKIMRPYLLSCRKTKIAKSNNWLTKYLTMQNIDQLDGTVSFRELLGQRKVMQIHQGETLSHQGAITHEFCCSSAQFNHRGLRTT